MKPPQVREHLSRTLQEQCLLKRNSVYYSQKFTVFREHHILIVRIYFQNNLYLCNANSNKNFQNSNAKQFNNQVVDKFNTTGYVDDLSHLGKPYTATTAAKWDEVHTGWRDSANLYLWSHHPDVNYYMKCAM